MSRETHDEVQDRLARSPFLHLRSGALYGLLSWLMAAGLFGVYFGATQGDDGDTVRPWIVAVGWLVAVVACLGIGAMLRHLIVFLRGVRDWVAAETAEPPGGTPVSELELKLTQTGRQLGSPGIEFVWGGVLLPPGGVAVPIVTAIFVAIGISDAARSAQPSGLDLVLLACALAVALFAVTVPATLLLRLEVIGHRLRKWRRQAVDLAAAKS